MCVSPASLVTQQARQLEWRSEDSDDKNTELGLSNTLYGLPSRDVSEDNESLVASTSGSETPSQSHDQPFQRLTSELQHQLSQLQQVRCLSIRKSSCQYASSQLS